MWLIAHSAVFHSLNCSHAMFWQNFNESKQQNVIDSNEWTELPIIDGAPRNC